MEQEQTLQTVHNKDSKQYIKLEKSTKYDTEREDYEARN